MKFNSLHFMYVLQDVRNGNGQWITTVILTWKMTTMGKTKQKINEKKNSGIYI